MVWDDKGRLSVPNHPVVSQLGTLSGMDGTLRRLHGTLSGAVRAAGVKFIPAFSSSTPRCLRASHISPRVAYSTSSNTRLAT